MSSTRPEEPHTPNNDEEQFRPFDMAEATMAVLRMLSLLIAIGLLIFAGFMVVRVFEQIGSIVTEGKGFEKAAARMEELIHADKLSYKDPARNIDIEAGPLVAMMVLGGWYLLWIWIPLALLKIAGSIIPLALKK
ncbi:hypothetical protein [Stratiformator vulcanicus]|uniref:Uncharacterized protein n=1 Tax=Stratiformator vulcanicus TaxID=2527980 RepID=A0A517R6Y8_9PLAN|nr:hypothetical protein [Stratiformator vulcanicus]QDT39654.1 hypothetical protein Pan189_40630 [Stratiformator vulcanicus]